MREILAALPGNSVLGACARLGISRNTYYTWIKGRRPSAKMALRLARLTGYSLEEILGDGVEGSDAEVADQGGVASAMPTRARGREPD